MQPSGEHWSAGTVKQLVADRAPDAGHGRPDGGRCEQTEDVTYSVEIEISTKAALDKCRCNQRFCCIAQRKDSSGPHIPVTKEIRGNSPDHCPKRHNPSHPGAQCNQNTGGNSSCRPKYSYAIGFHKQPEAQPRDQEIS